MNTTDTLLTTIEAHPSTIREGADSMALLYKWKRDGGDGPGFMNAVQALYQDGLIEIMPGDDMRLRLTANGFARLDVLLPPEPAAPEAPAESESQAANSVWRGGAAASRDTPAQELAVLLLDVFSTLAVPAGHAVAADTLAKIWAMEGKRGGDLRTALDTLAANETLVIHRGDRTVFVLTESGAETVAQLSRETL